MLSLLYRSLDTSFDALPVHCPSLEDYDRDGLDGEECEKRLMLNRWGDLSSPFRLDQHS